MLYVLFGIALVLLVLLTGTALYFVLQKKEEKDFPTIHASGVFSLVRSSPRETLKNRILTIEQITEIVNSPGLKEKVNQPAEKYLELWEEILKNSINTIENGDMEGLQTYCYQIPEKDFKICGHLTNIYVTREQLRNFSNLIPPLHLGCQVTITPKAAWNTNLDGTGWKPFLPVEGKYPTPDWRTVVEIE